MLRKMWTICGLALLALGAPAFGQIEVYHKTATVEIGTSRQFSSYVPLSPNTVVWSVNGIAGGNSTIGTITSTGLYYAPAVAPVPSIVMVRATSTAYPDKFGEATVTLTRPTPWIWSASPNPIPAGNFLISLNGANYKPDAVVKMNGMPLTTTYVSPTSLKASGVGVVGTAVLTVYLPGPGEVTSAPLNVTFAAAAFTVSPTSATLLPGAVQTFTASAAATWMVNGVAGGSVAAGFISSGGVYTAPATPQTVTVTAMSTGSPQQSASSTVTITAPPVTVTPPSATVLTGGAVAFAASTAVNWQVNGVTGGSAATGTISTAGVYIAPMTAQTVTIRGVSTLDATKFGTATVTVQLPQVSITPPSASVALLGTVSFSANLPVNWQVNGVAGGNSVVGTISAGGVYSAPAVVPSPATVTVKAVNATNSASFATASVVITGPPPAVSRLSAGRFLEQAAFGPNLADMAKVQQVGIDGWLDEQFALPETPLANQSSTGTLRAWQLYNFVHAPDQLRQRVAYSLQQLVVTSLGKLVYADEIQPWMRVVQRNAFGNYRTLLKEVTLSPSMGKYLDLANSVKPSAMSSANENYPRELMQLFTIGLYQLNPDGSQKLDGFGQPIPTYDQNTVKQVALALTGWTYATAPGGNPNTLNWENFTADLEPRPAYHDTTAKSFLGCSLPAGQTIQQDLDGTIDCLFQHPNMGPFLATRLIRSMVKSNPSPAYIARISAVFANNGAGVRGDMKAVVRAILTDVEARQDTPDATSGRLKEPTYFISAFLRAMNGSIAQGNTIAYVYDNMGQSVLAPPSVFNWFSPMYRVPKSTLFGPEFQIYTPTEATLRANFLYQILTANSGGEITVDLTNFQAVAGNQAALLDETDRVLFYGRMPAGVRTAIGNALSAAYDNNQRVQVAIYLSALSGQYAVQY